MGWTVSQCNIFFFFIISVTVLHVGSNVDIIDDNLSKFVCIISIKILTLSNYSP